MQNNEIRVNFHNVINFLFLVFFAKFTVNSFDHCITHFPVYGIYSREALRKVISIPNVMVKFSTIFKLCMLPSMALIRCNFQIMRYIISK